MKENDAAGRWGQSAGKGSVLCDGILEKAVRTGQIVETVS